TPLCVTFRILLKNAFSFRIPVAVEAPAIHSPNSLNSQPLPVSTDPSTPNTPLASDQEGAGSLSYRRGPVSQAPESADNRRRVCVRWAFAGTRPAPSRCGTKRIEGLLNLFLVKGRD